VCLLEDVFACMTVCGCIELYVLLPLCVINTKNCSLSLVLTATDHMFTFFFSASVHSGK